VLQALPEALPVALGVGQHAHERLAGRIIAESRDSSSGPLEWVIAEFYYELLHLDLLVACWQQAGQGLDVGQVRISLGCGQGQLRWLR
jgi:hypothetical protein